MHMLRTQLSQKLWSRSGPTPEAQVARNIDAYAARAASYDIIHREIFNDIEQQRLQEVLSTALDAIASGDRNTLDFGSGTGNLTRHMNRLGCDVTAADVSPVLLQMVEERYKAHTVELVDGSLDYLPDLSYDLIGVYSVMHHIPDYLAAAAGLVRKLKVGGVLLIDHEQNDNYWSPPSELVAFRRENANARTGEFWDPLHKRWQHLLRAAVVPSRHVARVRKMLRISDEGDIHVYADDHINWDQMLSVLQGAGAELVMRVDYLAFREDYDERIWNLYRDRCNDHTCAIVRRI
jgi:ubiquinone/menaquinone biosynthesis C-methylase UbiE